MRSRHRDPATFQSRQRDGAGAGFLLVQQEILGIAVVLLVTVAPASTERVSPIINKKIVYIGKSHVYAVYLASLHCLLGLSTCFNYPVTAGP